MKNLKTMNQDETYWFITCLAYYNSKSHLPFFREVEKMNDEQREKLASCDSLIRNIRVR